MAKKRRRHKPPLHRSLLRKRWLVVGVPIAVFFGLISLAPEAPKRLNTNGKGVSERGVSHIREAFRYQPDDDVYALDFDPRKIRFGLLEGWDREQDAFQDTAALAYVSGPMYERHVDNGGREITVPLGDLKLGQRVWRSRNRTASIQRAYLGIRHNGKVDFSYGELTPERAANYDIFVGGLHSVYNDLEAPPPAYKGAYSISMGQRIRYYLPRIRMVMGLRSDGRLEILMSRDGLTLEQTKDMARSRGLVAAYMPDHASKSRFIIPGVKGFTEEDANWISGGATSFVHVPYMLRLSERRFPLQGSLMSSLNPKLGAGRDCEGTIECVQKLSGHLFDRSLAGLNRVMEQGVEPLARMIWAPKPSTKIPSENQQTQPTRRNSSRSPLREPPITADPLVLLELPKTQDNSQTNDPEQPINQQPESTYTLPPDLPPPLVLLEGQDLPINPEATPKRIPSEENLQDSAPETKTKIQPPTIDAPPPPILPPPPLSLSDKD